MIQGILKDHYGLEPIQITPLSGGFIHQVLRVETTTGPKVVKLYQGADWTPQTLAASLVAQVDAAQAGLPVPRLVRSQVGDLLTAAGTGWILVSEFLPGQQIPATGFTPELARTCGTCLGHIHALLARKPVASGSAFVPQTSEIRQRCLALLEPANRRQRSDAGDLLAIEAASFRLDLLHHYQVEPEHYAWDQVQVIHGDYYPRNLLFGSDQQLTAVIDWDFAQPNWRGIEVARAAVQCSVDEGGALDFTRVVAFLGAYHQAWPMALQQRRQIFGQWLNYLLWSLYPLPGLYAPGVELPQAWADLARSRHQMLVLVSENLVQLGDCATL